MGVPSVPGGGESARHEKVTAFASRSATPVEPRRVLDGSGLDLEAFGSEEPKPRPFAPAAVAEKPRSRRHVWLGAGLVLSAGVAVAAVLNAPAVMRLLPSQGLAARLGRVTIGTTPLGAEVAVDGQPRGLTPLTIGLEPGAHSLTLRRGTVERTIALQVAAGAEVTQHYEFAPQPEAASVMSTLSITTDPPGARVLLNGEPRGTAPITISDLAATRHRVTVVGENGSVERQVTTEPGVTTSVVFSLSRTAALSVGWLTVASPFEVQVVERGDVIGTSASPRFMIPAGSHEVDLVNDGLGFRERRKIDINQGATATIRLDTHAPLSANARPWADVLVDGRAVGQTPIANLSVTLGSHQVVFRHPDLGERQQMVVVTVKGPNRVAVDLTQ